MPDPAIRAFIKRARLRELRRLLGAVELHVGRSRRDGVRRKRRIDQSTCNKDYSCLEGLLPVLRHRPRR